MTLSHDVAGNGPTVVLLHSTVCDRRMWDPQVPALVEAGYQVIRPDMRGFGKSPMPDQPYNNADDVTDLLDLLGVDQAALIGASGGGKVALEIAARWPERVTALGLLCTAVGGLEPSPELKAFGDREDELIEAGDVAGATDLNVETWVGPQAGVAIREKVREMQQHAFEVQLAPTEEFDQIRHETDLAAIKAPALLISGAYDLVDFRLVAADLAERLADARLVELDWAGHLPSLERPDLVNPILLDFLAGTAPARP